MIGKGSSLASPARAIVPALLVPALWLALLCSLGCSSSGPALLPDAGAPPIDDYQGLAGLVTEVDTKALPVDRTDYTTGYSRTLYVATDGDDAASGLDPATPLRTLGAALAAARDGDAVRVRGGDYSSDMLELSRSHFVLAAASGEKVTVRPAHPGSREWSQAMGMQFLGPVEDVIVDGINLDGFARAGIVYGDTATQRRLIIKNLSIRGVGEEGISNIYPGARTSYLVDGLLIKSVRIEDAAGILLQCGDEEYPCAKNAAFLGVQASGPGTAGNDTAMDALAMVESDNVLVAGAVLGDVPGDGLDFKSTRVSVVGTVVRRVARNGLKMWKGGEAINSIVYDTGADVSVAMKAVEGSRYRLVNCVIAQHNLDGATSYAMTVGYDDANSTELEIINTIFSQFTGPIYVSPRTELVVRNSLFYGFAGGNRFLEVDGGSDYSSTALLNAAGFGTGNLDQDPLFLSTQRGSQDFHLQAGSPAVDHGTTGPGIPDIDIEGKPRPAGAAIDIGAYER